MKLDEQPMKAFPHPRPVHMGKWCGMDLRDYFAAKAMQAIISKQPHLNRPVIFLAEDTIKRVSTGAYAYADEMMEARKCK